MTILKINAITVPADSGDELARRFAQRAGAVDGQDGFEGFELLKPLDAERPVWLVVTRWRDEAAFQNWFSSRDFKAAHGAGTGKPAGHGDGGGEPTGHGHGGGEPTGHGHGGGGSAEQRPVGMSAELWSYEVVDLG